MTKLRVSAVTRNAVKPYLIDRHYAGRMPSISYAFGLFDGDDLIGVVTYGTPAGASQREGLLGKEHADIVLELNRLCLKHNRKNEASFLVAHSLKMLPRPRVIISYADSAQGHIGTVYQASNAIYLGLSEKRTDWSLHSKPHLHGQTVSDEFRGQPNRAALMRAKYGDDFYLKPRPRKHRYAFIIGSKKERRDLRKAIRYTEQPYPKDAA